jgi:L-arabinose isomerase
MERERLTGFTVNFLAVDSVSGLPTVPFVEAGKSLARGLGYAGEGDVLTAGFVGALLSVYPETTFTEMFCPDWEHDAVFLSHMGEMNYNLADGKVVLMEKPFPWTDVENPLVPAGRYKAGHAVLIDLAPGPENSYSLIASSVEMLPALGEDRMSESVRGWFRPFLPLPEFLRKYSEAGGTHHLALVYGADMEDFHRLGRIMGWRVEILT